MLHKRVVNVFQSGLIGVLTLGSVLAWSGPVLAQQSGQTGQQSGQTGQQSQPAAQQQDPRQMQEQFLADEVFVRLANSPSVDVTNIEVKGQGGGVITLSGRVATEQAKNRAVRIARRTPGVQDVKDNLRVDATIVRPVEVVSDEELSKRVALKLATETFPGARAEEEWFYGWEVEGANNLWEFDVEADGGVIDLEGSVQSYSDLRKAIEATRKVPGVRSVNNELAVRSYPYYGYPSYGLYGYGYPYYYGHPYYMWR